MEWLGTRLQETTSHLGIGMLAEGVHLLMSGSTVLGSVVTLAGLVGFCRREGSR